MSFGGTAKKQTGPNGTSISETSKRPTPAGATTARKRTLLDFKDSSRGNATQDMADTLFAKGGVAEGNDADEAKMDQELAHMAAEEFHTAIAKKDKQGTCEALKALMLCLKD
jgi:hypothetical protein